MMYSNIGLSFREKLPLRASVQFTFANLKCLNNICLSKEPVNFQFFLVSVGTGTTWKKSLVGVPNKGEKKLRRVPAYLTK